MPCFPNMLSWDCPPRRLDNGAVSALLPHAIQAGKISWLLCFFICKGKRSGIQGCWQCQVCFYSVFGTQRWPFTQVLPSGCVYVQSQMTAIRGLPNLKYIPCGYFYSTICQNVFHRILFQDISWQNNLPIPGRHPHNSKRSRESSCVRWFIHSESEYRGWGPTLSILTSPSEIQMQLAGEQIRYMGHSKFKAMICESLGYYAKRRRGDSIPHYSKCELCPDCVQRIPLVAFAHSEDSDWAPSLWSWC